MSGRPERTSPLGFDPFGAAVGLAILTGSLSIIVPFLAAPTGTLAALSIAAWIVGHRADGLRWLFRPRTRGWAALGVAAMGTLYLVYPSPIGPYRAAALGLSLGALWAAERGDRREGQPPGA